MPNDEQNNALVGLVTAVRRVWDAFQPAQVDPDGTYAHVVKRDDWIQVDGATEPIEIERLIRILSNSSLAAERLFHFIHQQRKIDQGNEVSEPLVTSSAAFSYAARMRDSLKTMVELLTGGEEVESITPDWMAHESHVIEGDDPVVIYYEPGCEKIAVRLAEVHQQIKALRESVTLKSEQQVQHTLDAILDHIRGGSKHE